MTYKQRRTVWWGSIGLGVFSIALVACNYISVPFEIGTVGEIFPKEKWTLSRGDAGQVISNVIDYTKGYSTHYDIFQFERGEVVSANLSRYLGGKKELFKGDTIFCMQSSDLEDQLITAKNALLVATAELRSKSSAEKEPLIREAEHRLEYTRKKTEEQKLVFDRAAQLYEKGFSSLQEFELQKWNYDLLEIEEQIAAARLENLKTGVKPQEVEFLVSQIDALKSRLAYLKSRQSQLLVTSPIPGSVTSTFAPDTFLSVTNYRAIVLHVPVKITDLPEFHEGQTVSAYFPSLERTCEGTILSVGRNVTLMDEQQVVYLSIQFENSARVFMPGMVVRNTLRLRKITMLEYLLRTLKA